MARTDESAVRGQGGPCGIGIRRSIREDRILLKRSIEFGRGGVGGWWRRAQSLKIGLGGPPPYRRGVGGGGFAMRCGAVLLCTVLRCAGGLTEIKFSRLESSFATTIAHRDLPTRALELG